MRRSGVVLCLVLMLVSGNTLWAQKSSPRKSSSKAKKTSRNNPPPAIEIPRAVDVTPGQFTPPPEAPRFALEAWKETRFEQDKFAISFPTKPNESAKTNAQNGVKTTEYEVITSDGTYSVTCMKLPQRRPETKAEVQQRLREMMKKLETGPYKWLGGKEIEVEGYPAVEFKFQYPQIEEISWQRFVTVDDYMYRIVADTIIRKPERKEPQLFMNSFKLLPRGGMQIDLSVPPPPPPAVTSSPSLKNVTTPFVVRVSAEVSQGTAVKKDFPPYPPEAAPTRAAGDVQVAIVVSEKGQVIEATAISGHELLRTAAVESARKWTFKPMEESGALIKFQSVLTFHFTFQ